MPDRDDLGGAWRVTPTEYLERRPATHSVPQPSSRYLTMRDGVRLAVDVYLPVQLDPGLRRDDGRAGSDKYPTVVILTPYYRRFKSTGPGADACPNAAIYRDMFVPRGYALVVVDVRGCGASFGARDSFRSPRERDDHREVAEWIASQPWCNGAIGSTGISYLGAAACFLASTGHPAVKAIAPLFAVSDTYSDHVFPGGIMCTTVTANYDDLVRALDLDQRDKLSPYPYFNAPNFAGPQPVDEDADGSLLAAAIEEHRDSFRLRDLAPEMAYREEATPHDPELHSGACSPYWHLDKVKGKVAIYSISGWYDGAAFANGSISRFLTNDNTNDRLLLGPWDHGARSNGSPWRGGAQVQFPLLAEVLRFFDEHLAGLKTGIADEARFHFHTVHEEKWQSAAQWPPHDATTRWFPQGGGKLSAQSPAKESRADYQVQFTTGTGAATRFERLGALAVTDYYHDWNGREDRMLAFTSEPFDAETELTGHAIVHLNVATSENDGSVFVYLSEIEADGRSRYITEGALRILHRATADCPSSYRATWPFRTFHREDAKRAQPGVAQTLRFALLPISWKLAKGSRLRMSIAGTDSDHFAQVPHGRPPTLSFALGGADASFVELPFRR
jgi:hypothetical protein